MSVHHATAGFDKAAAIYDESRPTYPTEAVEFLVSSLGIGPSSTVADIGAGTGKFTRLLLPTGAKVIAVEPIAGMREALASLLPDVDVREGAAEAMPLEDGSVDAVTVAQAFHWFNGEAALAEIQRVLKPKGTLGLIWNRRDLTQPLQAAINEIIAPHRGDAPSQASGLWRDAFTESPQFTALIGKAMPTYQIVTLDGLVNRVACTSFVADLPNDTRADVLRRVREVGAQEQDLRLRYVTEAYWCRRV